MEIKIPITLLSFNHEDIVEELLKLNPQLHKPQKAAWPQGLPDLEEPLQHIAVEVELSNLRNGWGQCLYYYRMGATEVHFVLAPMLYKEYKRKENVFINKNPLPNVRVYNLPGTPADTKKVKGDTSHVRSALNLAHTLENKKENVNKFIVDYSKDEAKKRRNMRPVLSGGDLRFVGEETDLYKKVLSNSIKVDNLIYCSKRIGQTLITAKVAVIVNSGMLFNDGNYNVVK